MQTFLEANIQSYEHLIQLIGSGEQTEEQRIYLSEIYKLLKRNELVFAKYKSYYGSLDHDLSIFQTEKVTALEDVHAEIKIQVRLILESL